jgi:hypothetical protein
MRGLWKAALLLAPALVSADWINEPEIQGETLIHKGVLAGKASNGYPFYAHICLLILTST